MEKQRWEESEKRREEERRSEKRKSQKKEDAGAGKGSKVAIHCAFPMICGSGGSKSRLAKAAGAEPCCQMREEKLHAVVARSTFPSQNAHKKHTRIRPLSEVDTPLWREAHFQVKMHKAHHSRTTFGSWDIEKVHAVVRSAFRSQMCKKHHMLGPVLKVEMWFCVAGARDSAHCQKWAKREGFVAFPKTMAGVGHLKRVWKDAFRVAGAVQETCSSEMLGGSGRWFPERGCILEHQIFRFAKMTLPDRCSTSYDLASLFRCRQLCTQLSIFKGSLAELLRFWRSQLRTVRKSRRIAALLMLSSSDRWIDKQRDKYI